VTERKLLLRSAFIFLLGSAGFACNETDQSAVTIDEEEKNVNSKNENASRVAFSFINGEEIKIDDLEVQGGIPGAVLQAAVKGVSRWDYLLLHDRITGKTATVSEKDYSSVSIGVPYEFITIPLEVVVDVSSFSNKRISKRNVWYFPILKNGYYHQWMKVKKTRRGWEAVGIGGNARSVQIFENAYFAENTFRRRAFLGVFEMGISVVAVSDGTDLVLDEAQFFQVESPGMQVEKGKSSSGKGISTSYAGLTLEDVLGYFHKQAVDVFKYKEEM